ncbi:hypothetical protein CMI37_19595 [Candidatus Pacearchaeota archaeon]|nr:hypothetical protein [Candidatus Pacearchaeota archaeon]
MPENTDAQSGTLVTPEDAGKGAPGVVSRWIAELELSEKVEKNWRERAKNVQERYRDEKSQNERRYSSSNRYNILYSNIQTICPALYNQSPTPDVRRRYRDADPVGKEISEVLERALSFTMDDCDFDRYMRLAIKDQQICGRGVTRVRYDPVFSEESDEMGDPYDDLKSEEVKFQHVNWADFRHGPGRTWEEVEWVAFSHLMTRDDLRDKFGDKIGDEVELDYTPIGVEDKDGDVVADTFKRATVWEIWCNRRKEVIFISKSVKERPLKTDPDPLQLRGFFPTPRPLYATENTDSLVPVEPFRFYRDQANELDNITRRISGIIAACKVRGIYDSTITEMSNLMDAGENMMIPAQDVLPLMQSGGLDKAVWMWPIEKIAGVLNELYNQREQIKKTIYEITGIADIMRGSTASSETLGAQQLKVQFGTMRLDDMGREIQRYARGLVRLAAEIISEHFSPDSLAMMTDIKLPSPEEKMMAHQQAQMMAQQQQPVPPQLEEILKKPTWEECMQVLRDDKQRSYRVDIETDSTIAGDQAMDQKSVTELLTGVSTFITNAGPAVAAGYLPLDAAKGMLMSAVRRFKMGREVEDALDMIGEDGNGSGAADDGQQQAQQAQQMEQQAAAQAEQMKMQMEQQNSAIKAQEAQQKAQVEQEQIQLDSKVHQASLMIQEQEIGLKERDMALKEFEAQKPEPDPGMKIQADIQMAREKMEFEASEADKQRQVDLAKVIMAEFNGPEISMTSPEDALARASEIMARINEVISATREVGGMPLEETTVMVMDDDDDFIEPVLQ